MSNIEEKKVLLEAYKKTENEWENLSPKQKAKKILKHLSNIEPKTEEESQTLGNQILIIEELEPEEIEEYLDELHKIIMKTVRETLNLSAN